MRIRPGSQALCNRSRAPSSRANNDRNRPYRYFTSSTNCWHGTLGLQCLDYRLAMHGNRVLWASFSAEVVREIGPGVPDGLWADM